jgi:asparagine synthase (glutamine-hydrolysing)
MKTHTQTVELDALDPIGPGGRNYRSEILAWDGRLDNRDDLLTRLKDLLIRGDTSDAALALAAFERWGTSGFVHLIGDWSAVVLDLANRTVVLASDFAGVRPLYYCRQGTRLSFSGSLESLVEATNMSELDHHYMAGLLMFGGCPNHTLYQGIYSVPPGHAVCVSAAGATTQQFWSLPMGDTIRYASERRYEEELRMLFREAVAVRMRTGSTVLAELSGGLDSSSVVSMASELIRSGSAGDSRLNTVSYLWPGSLDEAFIHEVESFCGIEGVHISTLDDPFMTQTLVGGAMPEAFAPLRRSVAAVARRMNAQVFMTGQIGDLILGNWFNDSLQITPHLRSLRIGRAWEEGLAWSKILGVPVYSILWRALQAALPPALASSAGYADRDGSYAPKSTETSLIPSFCQRIGLFEPGKFFSDVWIEARPERRKHFRALSRLLELRTLQAPGELQHLDYTHPFAHRPLVEFLMTVPTDVLCGPGEPRKLMRRALSDLWPPNLRKRRSKALFSTPWHHALQPLARDLLAERHLQVVERGLVDRASLLARLERLSAGLDCNESQLQHIILLELWLRKSTQSLDPRARLLAA